jgi:hypothetical protein
MSSPSTRQLLIEADPFPGVEGHDYADAFEVRTEKPDARSAEQWARCALEESPAALRRAVLVVHRGVLRFRLGSLSSPDHVLGWRVLSSEPGEIRLEATGPLMRGVMIGRRTESRVTEIRTFLFYRRHDARLVWAIVGPAHRRIAPYLLKRAASAG